VLSAVSKFSMLYFCNKFFFKILFIGERVRARERELKRESTHRGKGRERSILPVDQGAQWGVQSQDPKIMT